MQHVCFGTAEPLGKNCMSSFLFPFFFSHRHRGLSYDIKLFQNHTIEYLFMLCSITVTPKIIGRTQSKNRWCFVAQAHPFDSCCGFLTAKSSENVIYSPLPFSNLFHKHHTRQAVLVSSKQGASMKIKLHGKFRDEGG